MHQGVGLRGRFTTHRTGGDCAAFLPFPDEPAPVIELVPVADKRPWRRGAPLFQVLEQAGLAPVVTRARERFVSQRLLRAFRDAVGSAPARRGLHEFGYRLPQALAKKLRPGGSAHGIAQRVSAALATECVRALDEGELTHSSQADVLAHALFGFPVVHGGLLRYIASRRVPSARAAARVLGRSQP